MSPHPCRISVWASSIAPLHGNLPFALCSMPSALSSPAANAVHLAGSSLRYDMPLCPSLYALCSMPFALRFFPSSFFIFHLPFLPHDNDCLYHSQFYRQRRAVSGSPHLPLRCTTHCHQPGTCGPASFVATKPDRPLPGSKRCL